MFSTGNTTIVLYKDCPITPTNQIDFTTKAKQEEYFGKLESVYTQGTCKYKNRNNIFKIKAFAETVNMCNYGYYENSYNGVTKRYYFYVDSITARNSDVSELKIVVDSFQTYLFDFSFLQSFIEREHVSDDTIGTNIIPESLETGEYINLGKQYVKGSESGLVIVCGVADVDGSVGGIYNGIYQGLRYWSCSATNWTNMSSFIQGLCDDGKADAVVNVFVCPKTVVSNLGFTETGGYLNNLVATSPTEEIYTIEKASSMDGYTPRNNKCWIYPFNVISVRNWNGCTMALKPELFDTNKGYQFNFSTCFSSGAKGLIEPVSYGNYEEDSNCLDCEMAIQTSWASDVYANWYAQNTPLINASSRNASASYNTGIANANLNYTSSDKIQSIQNTLNQNEVAKNGINSSLGALGSLMSLNLGGAVTGVASTMIDKEFGLTANALQYEQAQIGYTTTRDTTKASLETTYQNEMRSIMASVESHSIMPCEAKGDTTSCGLDFSMGRYGFVIEEKGMRYDNARMVDFYFQMYGYKVDRVGLPKLNNRKYWNYVKTLNCHLVGSVPREDLEKISAMFDNGITIWHYDGSTVDMFNYDRENTIVS